MSPEPRLAGMDVSTEKIARAKKRIQQQPDTSNASELFVSSLTYRDDRLKNYDAAILCEVIEHFDRCWIDTIMDNILGYIRPNLLILTTPNRDYNITFPTLEAEYLRHSDHRFEFSTLEFTEWCYNIASIHSYTFEYATIGKSRENIGAPTLMGVFTKCA